MTEMLNNSFATEKKGYDMTEPANTYEEQTAPHAKQMLNNPNAPEVVQTMSYGEHEIAITDDGVAIVNGEHVCFDQSDVEEPAEDQD
jgi:hypothetical protein